MLTSLSSSVHGQLVRESRGLALRSVLPSLLSDACDFPLFAGADETNMALCVSTTLVYLILEQKYLELRRRVRRVRLPPPCPDHLLRLVSFPASEEH